MNNQKIPKAANRRTGSGISVVWLLPVIAIILGAWLGWDHLQNRPIRINIEFASGDGIIAGKTELKYQGITFGKVIDLNVKPDLKGVIATIDVDRRAEPVLNTSTQFWLVKPQIDFSGVSGLDTLLRGYYIATRVSLEGYASRYFVALLEAPTADENAAGLNITLNASSLGSLHRGSPINYKHLQVGEVTGYQLANSDQSVDIKVNIYPKYQHLVNNESIFWNSSGIQFKADISGVEAKVDSLASIIAGGINLDTPQNLENIASDKNQFQLFDDYEAANKGIQVEFSLKDAKGIQTNATSIKYKGWEIGKIVQLDYDPNTALFTAIAEINPTAQTLLKADSYFWLVKPSISLQGVKDLSNLILGDHIELKSGHQETLARRFTLHSTPPPLDFSEPGIFITLSAKSLPSISVGTPLLYRQIKVGEVRKIALKDKQLVATLHLPEEYQHLVNSESKFWNISGLELQASFSGVKIKSPSLMSLLQGGINLYSGSGKAIENLTEFPLYRSESQAFDHHFTLTLKMPNAEGLSAGTKVKYLGLEVGEISTLSLTTNRNAVVATLMLEKQYREMIRESSQFWKVKPKLNWKQAEHLDTLITGQFITFSQGQGELTDSFTLVEEEVTGTSLYITLQADELGSTRDGMPILYRGIQIGQVLHSELSPDASRVNIQTEIYPKFTRLIYNNNRFYTESGVNFSFGLLDGAKLKSKSFMSMLEGGINMAIPENNQGDQSQTGQLFSLSEKANPQWKKWKPKLALSE